MDKLNIDFRSLFSYIIDAFTQIYGEEYRSIISKKINNALIISYYDIEGLHSYLSYIKNCKKSEYSIKFLDKIGIDVKKYIKDNYTEYLGDEIENILDNYIGTPLFRFTKNKEAWIPIQSFKQTNNAASKQTLRSKIKIINYLLDNNHEEITEENFGLFTKTDEYQILLKKINELNIIYEKLLSEYMEWEAKLQPFEEYVKFEEKRKEDILKKKKMEMFTEIFQFLPLSVKNAISNKTLEEQCNEVLGNIDIGSKSIIESFKFEQLEKLNLNSIERYMILSRQSTFLNNLGLISPNENISNYNHTEYLTFINQDNIRKYIPSEEVIKYISSVRERKYEEALNEYYTTRKDFLDIIKKFDNNENNINYIYNQIKNKAICIAGHGGTKNNDEFVSIMFYAIRDGGNLFYTFMHEIGHIIDQCSKGCGFESIDDFGFNSIKNPYDNKFRKYEKFNETLNDIFTIEAIKFLQNQGIYLIEPKEFTLFDTSNQNTSLVTKNLLKQLLQLFRQQVIKAKINANPEELTKCIGKDNFEELVDIVNKVDYLLRNRYISESDDTKYAERLKNIYNNIENYYKDNIESSVLMTDSNIIKSK